MAITKTEKVALRGVAHNSARSSRAATPRTHDSSDLTEGGGEEGRRVS